MRLDNRYCFKGDGEGHWYCLPVGLRKKFLELLESNMDNFEREFGGFRMSGGPGSFSFENPKEDL